MDGLAAGVGLVATVTMVIAALTQGNLPLALATIPLAGCLLGFLRYNFNGASVFLGDSGSLLIGFLLGCYGALWSEKSVTLVALTVPLLAVSIPLLEVALSIVRRYLRNRPIFEADRGHIHHKLLERGLSPKGAVLTIYAFCGVVAMLSLVASFNPKPVQRLDRGGFLRRGMDGNSALGLYRIRDGRPSVPAGWIPADHRF